MVKDSVSKEELSLINDGYKSLFVRDPSPTAGHLVKQMFLMHDELIRKSQKSNDPHEAFGLLKEASGIIKVLDHIKTKTGIELRRD